MQEYANKDSRIKLVDKDNEGMSIARNIGLDMAKGEFIGFVDSDDYIDENFYNKLYASAKKHNADIACASIYRVREERRNKFYLNIKKEKIFYKTEDKYSVLKIPKNCFVWNKIYNRKKLTESKIYFEAGTYYEDIYFTHQILLKLGAMTTVSNTKYYYCENKESIVAISNDKKERDYTK